MLEWSQIIPAGPATAIGTAIGTAIVAAIASKIKGVPFKIVFGSEPKNGKTLITADMLKENCEKRQGVLDRTLKDFMDEQKEIRKEIGTVREDMAFIKGRVSMRRSQ